jgi:uncharacterized Fe-S cluster-containing radical SAM superfamily protein
MSRNAVTFVHLRRHDMFGNLENFGGMTVAVTADGAGCKYAIARCHDSDRYVKQAGRAKAAGRLNAKAPGTVVKYVRTLAMSPEAFINGLHQVGGAGLVLK